MYSPGECFYAKAPDEDMTDAPVANPEGVDMKEDSDPSGLLDAPQDKINSFIHSNNSVNMDVNDPEDMAMIDGRATGADPAGEDDSSN